MRMTDSDVMRLKLFYSSPDGDSQSKMMPVMASTRWGEFKAAAAHRLGLDTTQHLTFYWEGCKVEEDDDTILGSFAKDGDRLVVESQGRHATQANSMELRQQGYHQYSYPDNLGTSGMGYDGAACTNSHGQYHPGTHKIKSGGPASQQYEGAEGSQPGHRTSSTGGPCKENKADRRCTCRRNKCLKLYCMCFAHGVLCNGCTCVDCLNTEEHMEQVQAEQQKTLARNPLAFSTKVNQDSSGSGSHKVGCRCRRSKCIKKYCECFDASVLCSVQCRCIDCENTKPGAAAAAAAAAKKTAPASTNSVPATSVPAAPVCVVGMPPMSLTTLDRGLEAGSVYDTVFAMGGTGMHRLMSSTLSTSSGRALAAFEHHAAHQDMYHPELKSAAQDMSGPTLQRRHSVVSTSSADKAVQARPCESHGGVGRSEQQAHSSDSEQEVPTTSGGNVCAEPDEGDAEVQVRMLAPVKHLQEPQHLASTQPSTGQLGRRMSGTSQCYPHASSHAAMHTSQAYESRLHQEHQPPRATRQSDPGTMASAGMHMDPLASCVPFCPSYAVDANTGNYVLLCPQPSMNSSAIMLLPTYMPAAQGLQGNGGYMHPSNDLSMGAMLAWPPDVRANLLGAHTTANHHYTKADSGATRAASRRPSSLAPVSSDGHPEGADGRAPGITADIMSRAVSADQAPSNSLYRVSSRTSGQTRIAGGQQPV